LPAGLPLLRADGRAVKQLLLNFLSNAVKFTPAGGHVTVRASRPAGRGLSISVSDTGIGMSEAEIEVALSPFGQVDSKLARKHQGTGLGLPICKSLMELHGGDLTVASRPNQGTTLTARFPAERVSCAQDASSFVGMRERDGGRSKKEGLAKTS
jgi:signal transduction histidine kinase